MADTARELDFADLETVVRALAKQDTDQAVDK